MMHLTKAMMCLLVVACADKLQNMNYYQGVATAAKLQDKGEQVDELRKQLEEANADISELDKQIFTLTQTRHEKLKLAETLKTQIKAAEAEKELVAAQLKILTDSNDETEKAKAAKALGQLSGTAAVLALMRFLPNKFASEALGEAFWRRGLQGPVVVQAVKGLTEAVQERTKALSEALSKGDVDEGAVDDAEWALYALRNAFWGCSRHLRGHTEAEANAVSVVLQALSADHKFVRLKAVITLEAWFDEGNVREFRELAEKAKEALHRVAADKWEAIQNMAKEALMVAEGK